jgi:hypothetical protein
MDQKEFKALSKEFTGKTIQTTSGRNMKILSLKIHGAPNQPDFSGEFASGDHKYRLGERHGDHYPLTDLNGNPQLGLKIQYKSLYELMHEKE